MRARIESNLLIDPSTKTILLECMNLMPDNHPALDILDKIFEKIPRPSNSLQDLKEGGFTQVRIRHRGITFAEHPLLPEFFFKLACDQDSDAFFKHLGHSVSDNWVVTEFAGRIKKRNEIAKTVHTLGMTNIVVPKKWLYIFPKNSTPQRGEGYQPKSGLIIAEKITLLPSEQNMLLWKEMSEDDQKDLFILVMKHQLHDAAPNNIWYTTDGRLAFIDTKEWGPRIARPDLPMNWFGPSQQKRWRKLRKYGLPSKWRGLPRKWKGYEL